MKHLTTLWMLGAAVAWSAAAPVLRVVQPTEPGASLLRNGDFEDRRGEELSGWRPYEQGFRVEAGAGRGGSAAVACENSGEPASRGASQTLALDRMETAPLVIRGWSRAQAVSGGADSGYSLYADLVYQDGTPLWGRTVNFRCGTHDWERRELVILPEKPVKTLTLYCLFRGHNGKVWFDDVAVEEVKAEGGAVLFQGVPVVAADGRRQPVPPVGRVLTNAAAGGVFLARDAAANSDFFGFEGGACPELGLKVATRFRAESDHTVIEGRLADTTGRDRAVTLVFALPLDATGWRWGDDIRRNRVIEGTGEFANQVAVGCGATGTMSLYPLAAVWNDRAGLALALDMARPAQYRLVYHAGTKQFLVAYDFGLVKESERFPGAADFRLVVYRFDPRWGFRAAFQKFTEIFPAYFTVRAPDQGLWMPFTDVSRVHGWEDFRFKFHEGNNNVAWDDAHGVLSFRYTEPMTWWMPMKPDVPRTPAAAGRLRDEMADGASATQRGMAQAARVAAMFDETGQPALLFRDTPWCNGAVWSLNPNPFLGDGWRVAGDALSSPVTHHPSLLNAATIHWNAAIKRQLYGPDAKSQLDGEYLDSLEGYVTADLNFRREHFRFTSVPLTFAGDTKQPALFKGLAVFEFTRWIAADVHRLGKLMFANGVPYRFTFLCPWLDVLGTETDWLRGGKYSPAADAQMSLWRTMSGQKPYLLLMNTDYDAFGPAMVEKYFQRSLFYGMWPGMFSHDAADNPYWQNPKWYERDRPLFRKYLPLIQRVAEAGWQPVTEATCDNANIFVERFGPRGNGPIYFTLLNDTAQPQSGVLQVNGQTLGVAKAGLVTELPPDEKLNPTEGGWRITLQPQEAKVIRMRP